MRELTKIVNELTDNLFAVYFHKITYYLYKKNSIVIKNNLYISDYHDKHYVISNILSNLSKWSIYI